MGCYLYCIVPRGHAPPRDLSGIEGADVRMLEADLVAAWYSELDGPPEPSLDHIRDHDRVAAAAMSNAVTPLPARFGQRLADAAALTAVVSASATEYAAALEAVAGSTEFGVTLIETTAADADEAAADADETAAAGADDPATSPSGGAGQAYLHKLAARHRRSRRAEERGERLLQDLADALGPLVRQERSVPTRRDGELARVAHLVDRGQADDYAAAVRGFRDRHGDVRTVLAGPWPPYSFGP